MRFPMLLGRALRLRCPLCGQGKLFRGWLRMHDECPHCGLKFEREPGFFLGSIYINYGLTAAIVAIAYPLLLFQWQVPEKPLLLGAITFTVIFPILLFPWARSIWLGFDQWHDPRDIGSENRMNTGTAKHQAPSTKSQTNPNEKNSNDRSQQEQSF